MKLLQTESKLDTKVETPADWIKTGYKAALCTKGAKTKFNWTAILSKPYIRLSRFWKSERALMLFYSLSLFASQFRRECIWKESERILEIALQIYKYLYCKIVMMMRINMHFLLERFCDNILISFYLMKFILI